MHLCLSYVDMYSFDNFYGLNYILKTRYQYYMAYSQSDKEPNGNEIF